MSETKIDRCFPEPKASTLASLPSEILDAVVACLAPDDLVHTSLVCKRLADLINRDQIWQDLIRQRTSTRLLSPEPFTTWKELYGVHHPHWFLTQRRLWFSDDWPYGKLLIARYDLRRGCIEAYAVAATHNRAQDVGMLDWGLGEATYQDFEPIVQLDLNAPVVRLTEEDYHRNDAWDGGTPRRGSRMRPEVSMRTVDRMSTSFSFTKDLPTELATTQTKLWPPLTFDSPDAARTRAASSSSFRSIGHRPYKFSEASSTSFRVRTRMPSHPLMQTYMAGIVNMPNERVNTFGTLDPACYTPTPEKPYRGIWVGDYAAHGCEFLVLTQPDDPDSPLPEKARLAAANWPRCAPWQELWPDQEPVDFEDAVRGIAEAGQSEDVIPPERWPRKTEPNGGDLAPHRGRLIATKLTGDPNVPRGEHTFIVSSLGEDGLVGYTRERGFVSPSVQSAIDAADNGDPESLEGLVKSGWKGSRAVKSVLHIADAVSRRDSYIPSQTVLVSEDVIAVWWMIAPHVSFYRRVDLEALLKV